MCIQMCTHVTCVISHLFMVHEIKTHKSSRMYVAKVHVHIVVNTCMVRTVGSKKKLTFRNRDYLVIRKKVCRKCVPQFVLFSTFAFRSMFIRTTPSIFTFVLRLAIRKTTIRSY